MTTIAIGNLKGGVGTTTLAVNLAALLQHGGHDVTLVDCSGGVEVYLWLQRRQREGLGAIRYQPSPPDASSYGDRSSYTIIDAGSNRKAVLPLLPHVDIWLAPTPPAFPDFMSTVTLFDFWQEARHAQSRSGMFASAIVRVDPNERALEWEARRKLAYARQDMLVLKQSLTRHAAWDATYSGHALHELPTHVAGSRAGEFTAMVGQFFAMGLLWLASPPRHRFIHNGQQVTAAHS